MIHSITSDKDSFKKIEFKSGFNVILAERTKESTKKDSRNGLGKSTLIEIIHFCLGGNKGETLSKSPMEDWTFTLKIDLNKNIYFVSRNISHPKKVIIDGNCSDWPIKPVIDNKTGRQTLDVSDWNRTLGVFMFGLQHSYDELKYVPTFISLISYFIRKNGHSGAFLNPFQYFKSQQEWNKQVHNAFLLGLGWEFASKWQILKDRDKVLGHIKREAESGILTGVIGSVGKLEALQIRLEANIVQEEKQLKNFKVHPQYREIEKETNEYTRKIHELSNENISDKRLIEHYELSLKEEAEAKVDSVTKIYKEYFLLQNNHQKKSAELKDVNIRLESLKKFDKGKSAITVDNEILHQQALTDLSERKTQKEKAVLLFNSNSEFLYDAPGTLSIDVAKTGFKFGVNIERSGSHGIGNMKIFCYDLMLAQIFSENERNPSLLIHDSIIFADVDERQKALALERATQESNKREFQYICTFNSDNIPEKDFKPDFNFKDYVRITLTDATDEGGLLGVRF